MAPTEVDTVYRHTHVHGVVHDENAHAMGGVAGHAGLFSTAADLSRFARMMVNRGATPERRLLGQETVETFTRGQSGSDRALGWQKPTARNIGAPFSASAFGHTGFTGTSLWMDPERDLYVVLLTNRVNPTRAQGGVSDLRRTVHALAVRAAAAGAL
ncbi:MAG TPA: serine hydrolase [Longimicrobiales bacterium]|nr:serine hydrolase [Longimicrobiales bacterium]